jgi:hypothetical protein
MEKVREVMDALGVRPRLRLARKLDKEKDGRGGVESYGPKTVKFLAEPEGVTANDFQGKPAKHLRFLVEQGGREYYWYVPVLNREGQANYLLERVEKLQVGEEYILQMKAKGGRNHVEITNLDGSPVGEEVGEDELDKEDDERP